MTRFLPLFALSFVASLSSLSAAPTQLTGDINTKVFKQLPFENSQDFEDATHHLIAPLSNKGVLTNQQGEIIWNGDAYNFLNAKNVPGAVNPSLWRQAQLMRVAGLFKVVEGLYQVRGADLSNLTIIEGKEGIILVDPLTREETAKAALDLYYEHRPNKPIKAVIYTHSHIDHFGGVKGVVSQSDVDSGKVKVFAPEGFVEAVLSDHLLAANAISRRVAYAYGTLLPAGPEGQVSAGIGLAMPLGSSSLILPTDFISKTGQQLTIDGVKFVFIKTPNSEASAEMLFYLPDFKALAAAEDATHTMHAFSILSGSKTADAKAWVRYLDQVIDQFGDKTEVVFAQHHWPIWGRSRAVDFLEKQRDLYQFLHDQTLRLANHGYTPEEIVEMIKLPDSLSNEWYNRGYFGSENSNAKSIYSFYLGWFDGNPASLDPLSFQEASKKYVEYMGGAAEILQRAKKDYEEGNYRWVAQVLNQLVYAEPTNKHAKELLSRSLEQLGYQAENAPSRNFYLTAAEELRHGIRSPSNLTSDESDLLAVMPTHLLFDYLAVRLDGAKASENPMTLNINLNDRKEKFLVQIKNGVLHAIKNRHSDNANVTISLNQPDFIEFMLGKMEFNATDPSIKIEGNLQAFKTFTSLFDPFNPVLPLVEPHTKPEEVSINKQ